MAQRAGRQQTRKAKPPVPPQTPAAPQPQEPDITAAVLNDEDLDVSAIKTRIEDIIFGIGSDALSDTQIPRPKNRNNGEAASRFVESEIILKAAEKRHKEDKANAEKEGVFGDPETFKEGETKMVYNTPFYAISMKIGNPSRAVDKDLVADVLQTHLPKDKAIEAMEACFKRRSAPKQVIVSMK